MTKQKFKVVTGRFDEVIDRKKSVGWNIVNLRKYIGITQRDLAKETGIDIRLIRKYEHDEKDATANDMRAISSVLGVSCLSLFFQQEYNEMMYDNKTGLTLTTLKWLEELNGKNNVFIKMINSLSANQQEFRKLCRVIKAIRNE